MSLRTFVRQQSCNKGLAWTAAARANYGQSDVRERVHGNVTSYVLRSCMEGATSCARCDHNDIRESVHGNVKRNVLRSCMNCRYKLRMLCAQ